MKLFLGRFAGFCSGVDRAFKIVYQASKDTDENIYTYGPIVHNEQVTELLEKNNVKVIHNIDEIDKEKRCKIFIRAHGVTPEEHKELEKYCEVIDATCPHVSKAQKVAKKYTDKGFTVIIIGDKGHAEVKGILGHTGDTGYIVEDENDIENLPNLKKVCVIAQTTQASDRFKNLSKIIRKKFPDAVVRDTICKATDERQNEVKQLASLCDAVLVVGGKASANTKRLYEISKKINENTYFIETKEEIDLDNLKQYESLGIIAGASTPGWVIKDIVNLLNDEEEK